MLFFEIFYSFVKKIYRITLLQAKTNFALMLQEPLHYTVSGIFYMWFHKIFLIKFASNLIKRFHKLQRIKILFFAISIFECKFIS